MAKIIKYIFALAASEYFSETHSRKVDNNIIFVKL